MSQHELFQRFKEDVQKEPERYIREYVKVQDRVNHSPAIYKGEPVKFLYQPYFFSDQDIRRFKELTNTLGEILKKVIRRYMEEPDFRKHFGFSPYLEELILKDPGYHHPFPMARFDIFYHQDGSFQFCELNADGSSGMVEARELDRIIYDSLALDRYKEEYDFHTFELFDSWIDALRDNYHQFAGTRKTPQVAIVDFIKDKPPSEFVEFQKAFQKRGYSTIIADPRDLELRGEHLYHGDFRIDCIYRRTVTWEVEKHRKEVQDYVRAYLQGKVCIVGSFRSQIIHNKIIFSVLHDEEATGFLNPEEREFIQRHIPFTVPFSSKEPRLLEMILKNKDRYVLKPSDKFACHGVSVGRDYLSEQWRQFAEEEVDEEYLIQEFCNVPSREMAIFSKDQVTFQECNYITGVYVYNGSFQGIYHRAGRENIIGSLVEGFSLPNYLVRKK
ncbi:glutathionylspermidine synthase family protein [Isachenkonia alkalipeptolytica]|uniref:Glutathionylspermidine synthase pre-ATP-grasp-like domain-containing protein n=1 Tax=Isachenkonia alkalipeptolytica TaxID=2565777 RepID=A0AA44BEZ7_9CLOT|nr:glutathionylspermidine synthase family protein [Isachenkonia alkalipeptolytica]NBG88061.1 hypothetical protein [Isachenkonia alkalipeptolytica]